MQSSYKAALKDARKQYEDAVNFKYYWTYKPQGVSIIVADTDGHDNVQTGRGYRMSNNDPWYSNMYKEYGDKATKDQMLDVAYKNERAELAASSPELLPQWDANVEAAKQRYETLRDMGEKFKELSHSDHALRKTFSKEGAAVYQNAVKTFQQGNQAVSQAAKENAYLYARMAERWAQIRRDYGDTAYTAKDFAAAHPIHIGGTGSDVQFGQAMFDVRKSVTKTFEEFINKIKDRKQKGKPANKLMFIGNSGVIYAEAQVVHATTPHHGHVLSAEQLDDIDAHIGSLQNAAISNKKDTAVFSGIPVQTHVKGKLGDYYVVIEIDDKGNTWFKTGFPGKAESIDNIIKTKIAEHSARILSHNAQGPSSQNKTAISLLSIQKELSNVTEKYKQAGHSNQVYQQGKIRGAFDSSTGAIHLFDAADQSSFIHESAHMYLTEMSHPSRVYGVKYRYISTKLISFIKELNLSRL